MSRIGKQPITLPNGVDVKVNENLVTVKGPKGELSRKFDSRISLNNEAGKLTLARADEERDTRALHGLSRALLNNMVTGVSTGFSKVLEITAESVGYRAEMSGKNLVLYVGYSHPVEFPPPAGITLATDAKTRTITVSGSDKELVGEIAARIRKVRPPEPYKGKGIKYSGEKIRRKAGKAGKTGKGAK
jgi:large subunit ribosomal protein L6